MYSIDLQWDLVPMPLSMLTFGLAWACTGLVHVVTIVTTPLCPCVQLPCCVKTIQFSCRHLPPPTLTFFLLTHPQ